MSEVDPSFPPFTSLERKQLAVLPGTTISVLGCYRFRDPQVLAFEGDPWFWIGSRGYLF